MTGSRFRLNHETATGKVIDGEAILINVVTGRYYSMCDASCIAWQLLSGGGSSAEVVEAITARYDAEDGMVGRDVDELVRDLLAEDLLVEAEPGAALNGALEALPPVNGSRLPYETARLQTFRDMEDLLAFDPPLPRVPEQFAELPPR